MLPLKALITGFTTGGFKEMSPGFSSFCTKFILTFESNGSALVTA